MILDRSGSMNSIASDTIGGVNRFFGEQRNLPGELLVTLVQFDDQEPFEVIHSGKPIKDVPELTSQTFKPRGCTPLLDAIGRGIVEAGKRFAAMNETDRPEKVLFVIMTDGFENASKEYTKNKVNEMISHQRTAYKWEFVFLGANQDAIATASDLGIAGTHAMTYAANTKGTQAAYASLSANVRNMRSGGSAQWSASDRDAQNAAGVK